MLIGKLFLPSVFRPRPRYAAIFAYILLIMGFSSCDSSEIKKRYPEAGKGAKVEVRYVNGTFRIFRNGKPFFIRGGAGYEQLDQLVSHGGNAIRTWETQKLDSVLNVADSLGLVVMVGLEVVPGRSGLDYSNREMVVEQLERIRKIIRKYKDREAVLFWAIGNELELNYDNDDLWPAVNELAAMVHHEDPDHPVTVVTMPIGNSVRAISRKCPEIDFISINAFSQLKTLPKSFRKPWWLYRGPYLVTEWGSRGWWEVSRTDWEAPIEDLDSMKMESLLEQYQATISGDTARCLGSFVFYWGQKQEKTHTWFSLFGEEGEKTPMVDAITYLWTGEYNSNRAPFAHAIQLEGIDRKVRSIYLKAGEKVNAAFTAEDPEGDVLTYSWEVCPEGTYATITGGDKEERPTALLMEFVSRHQGGISFKAPHKPGAYRLYGYVRDGKGNISSTNIAFMVPDNYGLK